MPKVIENQSSPVFIGKNRWGTWKSGNGGLI